MFDQLPCATNFEILAVDVRPNKYSNWSTLCVHEPERSSDSFTLEGSSSCNIFHSASSVLRLQTIKMDLKQPSSTLVLVDTDCTIPSSTAMADSNIYHIYHTGSRKNCYSIHHLSDSNTPLNLHADPDADLDSFKPPLSQQSTSLPEPRKVFKKKALDNPLHDPRTQTAPYFLHLPTVYGHCPPYTLRRGGTKAAPTCCLLSCSAAWRTWKLEFGDVLAQPGVVDGRGVVNAAYGSKKGEEGTLMGYGVRKKRWWGESGKAWHVAQAAALSKSSDDAIAGEKIKPDEIVLLKWTAPLSLRAREYSFSWRGFSFVWKGTGRDVQLSKKFWGPFVRYNHLKLVVLMPGRGNEGGGEAVLARYTCVVGQRKAGRLEVCSAGVDVLLNLLDDTKIEKAPLSTGMEDASIDDAANTAQCLVDVVMGTAMCMIIGEFAKRKVLLEVLLALAEGGG